MTRTCTETPRRESRSGCVVGLPGNGRHQSAQSFAPFCNASRSCAVTYGARRRESVAQKCGTGNAQRPAVCDGAPASRAPRLLRHEVFRRHVTDEPAATAASKIAAIRVREGDHEA